MIIMQLKNITLSLTLQTIFNNINLNIPGNEKIGVVGVNGVGKTTLFKLLMGLITPDLGEVIIKKGTRIDWLPQIINDEILNTDITTLEYLLQTIPIEKLNNELEKFI